jgi:hypothetical protein
MAIGFDRTLAGRFKEIWGGTTGTRIAANPAAFRTTGA